MKALIETIKNIFKIEDLRNRILFTLGIILIYRLGKYITLPGVDPSQLANLKQQTSTGIMSLLDMFSGGAFSQASIFALGIMPYISASIVVQLLGIAIPYFQRLQKEGESGRRRINQITRYLTVGILFLQAPSYLANLHARLPETAFVIKGTFFTLSSVIILTTGTMFVMWMGERITDKGIGNGISLIIMIGIIARLPFSLVAEYGARLNGAGGLIAFLVELILLFLVILVTILLVQGTRRVPVQYAKRIVGNRQYGGVRQYIPLKVNAAGVMPIIFAQAIMMLPLVFVNAMAEKAGWFATAFSNIYGFWYNVVVGLLIIVFTYFYTAVTFDPKAIASNLQKMGGFIPGIRPGNSTTNFLYYILNRVLLIGAIFLGTIAVLPSIIGGITGVTTFRFLIGGTSLLIVVAVVLETVRQIEAQLKMREYDTF